MLWAKSAGGFNGNEYPESVATDTLGNVILAGYFTSTSFNFGGNTLTNAGSVGSEDIFILKYDSAGTELWAKTAGGSFSEEANSITTDASGNIVVTGVFTSSSIMFGSTTFTGTGNPRLFIVKYDTSGNVLWAKSPSSVVGQNAAITDGGGNIVVTGSFSGSIVFGSTTLYSTGNDDIFVVKYDSNGNVVWAKKAGGIGYESGLSVATDGSGNIIVGGCFTSASLVFGSITLANTGGSSMGAMFITKYDGAGNVLWAKSAVGRAQGNDVSVDSSGNIFLTGIYNGNLLFDAFTLYGGYFYDIFISKYDVNGNVLFATKAGGSSDDYALASTIDVFGNVYVAGYYNSLSCVFNPTTLTTTLDNNGQTISAVFLAKLGCMQMPIITASSTTTFCQGGDVELISSAANSYLWSNGATTKNITASTSGNLTVTISDLNGCSATSPPTLVTVEPLLAAPTVIANGTTTFCQGDSVILSASPTNPYQWSNGATTQNITVNQSGTYIATVSNSCGTVNSNATTVTVSPLPITPTITDNGNVLTSTAASGNQWYLNGNIITGATSQNYTVTQNGLYSVVVTDANGCSATSAAYNFTVTGINSSANGRAINIYSSPISNTFTIETNTSEKQLMQVFDVTGKLMLTQTIQTGKTIIDASNLVGGIYAVCFTSNEQKVTKRLVVVK